MIHYCCGLQARITHVLLLYGPASGHTTYRHATSASSAPGSSLHYLMNRWISSTYRFSFLTAFLKTIPVVYLFGRGGYTPSLVDRKSPFPSCLCCASDLQHVATPLQHAPSIGGGSLSSPTSAPPTAVAASINNEAMNVDIEASVPGELGGHSRVLQTFVVSRGGGPVETLLLLSLLLLPLMLPTRFERAARRCCVASRGPRAL